MNVNLGELTSKESPIEYDYTHFDFCTGNDQLSPYNMKFLENQTCAVACKKSYMEGEPESDQKLNELKNGIRLGYQHNWGIEQDVVKWCYTMKNDDNDTLTSCDSGFQMGCFTQDSTHEDRCPTQIYHKDTFYLFNHVDFSIRYLERGNKYKIYSVRATPSSKRHDLNNIDCSNSSPLEISTTMPENSVVIIYTYSVEFIKESDYD